MTAQPPSRRGFLFAAGAGAAGLAAGAVLRDATSGADQSSEPPTSADIGFCTDMSTHHVQALAMCQRVLGRETGDAVQAAASEVLQTQAIEVGTMRAWLADWGQSTSSPTTVMAWMGMNDGAGVATAMMPGLANDDEMRSLSLAEGMAQGKLWIELMRAHHVGGVAMAEAAIDLANADKVRRLASTQAESQTFEISQYDVLLSTVYA
jgi:uncharacterized protein (DUF305 family)